MLGGIDNNVCVDVDGIESKTDTIDESSLMNLVDDESSSNVSII